LKARSVFLLALFLCLWGASAQADIVYADFVRAEVSPNSVTTPLPFLLNGPNDTIFLKFKIPNFDEILSINSFVIDVIVYDNGDGGGETGEFQFAQPGTNLFLLGFAPNLNHTTALSPVDFTMPLCACQISQIFPSLQDGTFRIKVLRDSGDFFLAGGSAMLDVNFAPEPSTLIGGGAGLLMIAGLRRPKARRTSREAATAPEV
jgi:hypothetical protein